MKPTLKQETKSKTEKVLGKPKQKTLELLLKERILETPKPKPAQTIILPAKESKAEKSSIAKELTTTEPHYARGEPPIEVAISSTSSSDVFREKTEGWYEFAADKGTATDCEVEPDAPEVLTGLTLNDIAEQPERDRADTSEENAINEVRQADEESDTFIDDPLWTEEELANIRSTILLRDIHQTEAGHESLPKVEMEAEDSLDIQDIFNNFQNLESNKQQEVAGLAADIVVKGQEILELRLQGDVEAVGAEKELVVMLISILQKVHKEPTPQMVMVLVQQLATEAFMEKSKQLSTIDETEGTHERKTGLQYLLQQLSNLVRPLERHQSRLGCTACRALLSATWQAA